MMTQHVQAESRTAFGRPRHVHLPPAHSGGPLHYQLDVAAATVVDVIAAAGGWLFDRAGAGWDITIRLDGCADARPLEILGVRVVPQDKGAALTLIPAEITALAVAGSVVGSDVGLRDAVAGIVNGGLTEVTLWGDTLPAGMTPGLDRVLHQLTRAARVFKAQALAAAGVGDALVGPTETFWSNAITRIAVMPDLIRMP